MKQFLFFRTKLLAFLNTFTRPKMWQRNLAWNESVFAWFIFSPFHTFEHLWHHRLHLHLEYATVMSTFHLKDAFKILVYFLSEEASPRKWVNKGHKLQNDTSIGVKIFIQNNNCFELSGNLQLGFLFWRTAAG